MIKPWSTALNYAVSCPGQGLVRAGMLAPYKQYQKLLENDINLVNDSLQENFIDKLFENDELWLMKTSNSQPAILTTTWFTYRLIDQIYGVDLMKNCRFVMGHSLGEYTGLLLAGIIDLPTAIKLVRKRGQLMEKLIDGDDFGMMALLFKSRDFATILQQIPVDILGNINSNQQIILSGKLTYLNLVIDKINHPKKIILKSLKLPVKISFHSSILTPIASQLSIDKYNSQLVPIISNLTGKPSFDSETTIKNTLEANYKPVQWFESMKFLSSQNITHLVNLGPGNVLSGLNKGFNIENINLDLPDSWNQIEKLKTIN